MTAIILALLASTLSSATVLTATPENRAHQPTQDGQREKIQIGDTAPEFSMQSSTGESISLSQFKGKKTVVLYFYPKDYTPGCTVEAEEFRDNQSAFEALGAVVLGVSLDSIESHKGFAKKYDLTFPLLFDEAGKTAKAYGVLGFVFAQRSTFIIGKDGRIKRIYRSVKPGSHAKEILEDLPGIK